MKTSHGFNSRTGEEGALFSGGQIQRIALARAFYRSFQLLVLDEATSALDKTIESKIIHNLRDFSKDITIIMVTHRPYTLEICDKVYELTKNGFERKNDNFYVKKK